MLIIKYLYLTHEFKNYLLTINILNEKHYLLKFFSFFFQADFQILI